MRANLPCFQTARKAEDENDMNTQPALITDQIRAAIGREESYGPLEVSRREIVKYSIATEQRLDCYRRGDKAPLMFLFGLVRPLLGIDQLGADGLAPDPLLPDLPLSRTMAGGTTVRWHREIRPGDVLVATRTLRDIYEKQGRSGPLIFVVYELRVSTTKGDLVVEEKQSRIVR